MQELVAIRHRQQTVETIHSVCSTLATVSAAKLSRARERALAARVYTKAVRGIVGRQLDVARTEGLSAETLSPLFCTRPVRRILLFVAGTDQGLCGGYNLELVAKARAFVKERTADGVDIGLLVRGARTRRALRHVRGVDVEDGGSWPRAGATDETVDELFSLSRERFASGETDEIWACYSSFISSVQRTPTTVRLLPVELPTAGGGSTPHYFYDPDRERPLTELLDVLARLQVEDVLLEAFASEQAARMVTMQEATERAEESMADLRVHYNRVRREGITAGLAGVLVAHRLRKERSNVA